MQAFIDAYRKELLEVNNFKPDTVSNYVSCLEKYFHYAREELRINPLQSSARHLRQWMSRLKTQGLGRSRLIHHQAALKRFFAVLIRLNVLDHNPAEALFPLKKQKSECNQPIARETAVRLLRTINRSTWLDERNFMIISMLWALGLRIGELTTLTVGSFEPHHDPISVNGISDKCIGLLRVRGKGDKERVLFIVDQLYENLTAYLAHPDSPKHQAEPLFPTTLKNKALSPNRIQRIIKQLVRQAGIEERITPHVLRHTFATHMYEHDVPIDAIETMLGHGSADETSIYIHVPETKKQQALQRITIQRRKPCP